MLVLKGFCSVAPQQTTYAAFLLTQKIARLKNKQKKIITIRLHYTMCSPDYKNYLALASNKTLSV